MLNHIQRHSHYSTDIPLPLISARKHPSSLPPWRFTAHPSIHIPQSTKPPATKTLIPPRERKDLRISNQPAFSATIQPFKNTILPPADPPTSSESHTGGQKNVRVSDHLGAPSPPPPPPPHPHHRNTHKVQFKAHARIPPSPVS